MTVVSHAQNFEDVMLLRALRDVDAGAYIDVGAHDPNEFSVTKLFYERGWRGINVEPVIEYFHRLEAARPDDINLNVAAGALAGTTELFVVAGTGLSTVVAEHAAQATARGYASVLTTVAVETLDEICKRLVSTDLHFLKVDVEGAEAEVLRGIDLERTRPWIIVVEATRPGTPELAYEEWEPLLTNHRYTFVYFDGLNRFYTAQERPELVVAFAAPPNVFDEFILAPQLIADQQLASIDDWIAAVPVTAPPLDASGRIDQLKARFAGLINLSQHLAADRSTVEAALKISEQALAAESVQLAGMAEQLETTTVECAALSQKISALESALKSELEKHVSASSLSDAKIYSLEQEAAIGDGHLADAHERLADAQVKFAAEQVTLADERAKLAEALAKLAEANANLDVSAGANVELERRVAVLDTQVRAFNDSTSWRVTAPLRVVMRLIKRRD